MAAIRNITADCRGTMTSRGPLSASLQLIRSLAKWRKVTVSARVAGACPRAESDMVGKSATTPVSSGFVEPIQFQNSWLGLTIRRPSRRGVRIRIVCCIAEKSGFLRPRSSRTERSTAVWQWDRAFRRRIWPFLRLCPVKFECHHLFHGGKRQWCVDRNLADRAYMQAPYPSPYGDRAMVWASCRSYFDAGAFVVS